MEISGYVSKFANTKLAINSCNGSCRYHGSKQFLFDFCLHFNMSRLYKVGFSYNFLVLLLFSDFCLQNLTQNTAFLTSTQGKMI